MAIIEILTPSAELVRRFNSNSFGSLISQTDREEFLAEVVAAIRMADKRDAAEWEDDEDHLLTLDSYEEESYIHSWDEDK